MKGTSPLQTYLADIATPPLLTADEERALAARVRGGDDDARRELIRAYLRMVVSIAAGYRDSGVDLDDLISEGNLGLIRACDRIEHSDVHRFSTYAYVCIRGAVLDAIKGAASDRITEARREELARRQGDDDRAGRDHGAPRATIPILDLPEDERRAIVSLYGLEGSEVCTYERVASEMGLSIDLTRKLELSALARLRRLMGAAPVVARKRGNPARLPDSCVPTVLRMIERGIPQRRIALEFGVSRGAIQRVADGDRSMFRTG